MRYLWWTLGLVATGLITREVWLAFVTRRQRQRTVFSLAEDRAKAAGKPLIVVGDFNTPPDSAIYRSFWSEYGNAFTRAGIGFGYTEWPEVRKVPFGIRIDHVLMTPTWRPRRCWVGPDVGSDHLPVIADLVEESR